MGWRNFQNTPHMEFMEFMESMPIETPLIPFIPLIPHRALSEKADIPVSASPSADGPRAWLENGELRSRGVFSGEWPDGGLTPEIIKLTADNMSNQANLLRFHVGNYLPGVHWLGTIRRWRTRAAHLFEQEGMGLHEANYQAAQEMHLLAFAEELKLKQPESGEGE